MIRRLAKNKHTTIAAGAYLIAAAVGHIGDIWFPDYSAQIYKTVLVIKEAAFGYGMLQAGDAARADSAGESAPASVGAGGEISKPLVILLLALLFLGSGCAAYTAARWTPDSMNYTVQVDHQTGDTSSYVGASWSLKGGK